MDAWMKRHGGGSSDGGGGGGGRAHRGRSRGTRPTAPPAAAPSAAPATAQAPAEEGWIARIWASLKKLGSANLALLFAAILAGTAGVGYIMWQRSQKTKAIKVPAEEPGDRPKRRRPKHRAEPAHSQASVGPPPEGYAIATPDPNDDGEPLPPLDP